ncbi:MAG: hypothetical protein WCL16_10480, partial [bacterium]
MKESRNSRSGAGRQALRGFLRSGLLRWVFIVACVCLMPARVRSEEPPSQPPLISASGRSGEPALLQTAGIQPHYDGRVRLDYDYRSQGESKDSDLYGYWYGGARDMGNGCLDFYASGWEHRDLDKGSPDEGSFRGLDDASGVSDNRLLQAYLDAHDRDGLIAFRAGRQYIDVADYLQLDGGQLMLFEKGDLGG